VATDVADRARNARELIFGRRIMDQILELGGWLKSHPSAEEQQRLIEAIAKRTTISQVGRNIIKIEYRDADARRALLTTQKFADLFIQEGIKAQADESSAAFDFIDQQTEEYREKLARTENALKELRSANLAAQVGSESDIASRVKELQARIERATQELREAEMKGISLESQISGAAVAATSSARQEQYRERIAQLQARLDTLRLSYFDTHPDIVQLTLQIKSLTDEAVTERERREQAARSGRVEADQAAMMNPIYQQLRRELSQNKLTIESLNSRIADAQSQLQEQMLRGQSLHSNDAQLADLTRDYQVNRDIYQDLLRRRENARVSMNLDRGRQGLTIRVLEPATAPLARKGPRFLHFFVGGIILGIVAPIALIFVRLRLDSRIRLAAAITDKHKAPLVASIPHLWTPREQTWLRWEAALLALIVVGTVAASAGLSTVPVDQLLPFLKEQ
jgi:polysaccharide chain length determinant protein (PEP-CTERM system associated)